jgi:hypothetical protein
MPPTRLPPSAVASFSGVAKETVAATPPTTTPGAVGSAGRRGAGSLGWCRLLLGEEEEEKKKKGRGRG